MRSRIEMREKEQEKERWQENENRCAKQKRECRIGIGVGGREESGERKVDWLWKTRKGKKTTRKKSEKNYYVT